MRCEKDSSYELFRMNSHDAIPNTPGPTWYRWVEYCIYFTTVLFTFANEPRSELTTVQTEYSKVGWSQLNYSTAAPTNFPTLQISLVFSDPYRRYQSPHLAALINATGVGIHALNMIEWRQTCAHIRSNYNFTSFSMFFFKFIQNWNRLRKACIRVYCQLSKSKRFTAFKFVRDCLRMSDAWF